MQASLVLWRLWCTRRNIPTAEPHGRSGKLLARSQGLPADSCSKLSNDEKDLIYQVDENLKMEIKVPRFVIPYCES